VSYNNNKGRVRREVARTDDEGNHGCAIATGGFEALDELLDLPDLNVLLRIVGLRLLGRHGRGGVWWCGRGGGGQENLSMGVGEGRARGGAREQPTVGGASIAWGVGVIPWYCFIDLLFDYCFYVSWGGVSADASPMVEVLCCAVLHCHGIT
jgi:hypothetical protein